MLPFADEVIGEGCPLLTQSGHERFGIAALQTDT
jgi:hypothetical protein